MPDTYTLLEKVVVGATSVASINFANIPQSYTDLQLVCSTRLTASGIEAIDMTFNNNTGANYSWRYIQGSGTSTTAAQSANANAFTEAMVTNGNTSTANTFSNSALYIPNYTSSSSKTFSLDTVEEENAVAAFMRLEAGLWAQNSAITSIQIYGSTNFAQYSTFYLYGIAKLGVDPVIAPKATGGDIIQTDGTYWYHAFLSSGTFTPSRTLSCGYLVVAGGGGSGDISNGAGGGAGGLRSTVGATGGGGSLESAISMTSGVAYTITVGAGGAGTVNGNNSSIAGSGLTTVTSVGGGKGGNGGAGSAGGNGGSGGGVYSASFSAGTGTANQGYGGGGPTTAAPNYYAGGGGGAGAAGSLPNGGNGVQITAFATPTGTGANGGWYR